MAGVTLISLSDPGDLALGHAAGDLLVLAGTLFAAFYVVASSRPVGEFAPLPLAALQQTVGPGFALLLPAVTLLLGWERPPPCCWRWTRASCSTRSPSGSISWA